MSMNVSSLSAGAACEPGKLIVQVVGINHPPGQRVVIYDQTDHELQEWLTNQDKPEVKTDETFSSVLHIWDWDGQPKRHLWLEIATSSGAPIRIPLLDDVRITSRQDDQQWNQIVPVIPFCALPGSKSIYDLGMPVLARPGFIYVFYQGKLWRELEVRSQGGKTNFHDIHVASFRQGQGFKSGVRQAIGQALEEIWLPSQWNNLNRTDIQLCFSEVQLSAARLQRLEQDNALRRQRCKSPDLRVSRRDFKRNFAGQPQGKEMLDAFAAFDVHDYANQNAAGKARVARLDLEINAFPISVAAPQRPREPGYEWQLEHPGRYICDLGGQFPLDSKKAAQAHLDGCEKGTVQENPHLLELGAWSYCLGELIKKNQPPSGQQASAKPAQDTNEAALWDAQPAVSDVLSSARTRQICGVLLDDNMHRMRHLLTRINSQQHALGLCAQRASQHANHGSALLLQQLVVPSSLGGQKNPLHQALEKITERGKRDINRFTATKERIMLWRQLGGVQDALSEHLGTAAFQQTLADHLSLDGFDYLAASFFASQVFAAIATGPDQSDPLAVNCDLTDAVKGYSLYRPKATPGQKLLSEIASNTKHPLHLMLWPDVDHEALYAPYQAPTSKDVNQGDGRFRPGDLAQFETQGAPKAQQRTLDAAMLVGLMAAGSLNSSFTAQLKAGASTLVNIYESLEGAVQTAQRAVDSASDRLRPLQAEVQARTRALGQASADYAQQRTALGAQGRRIDVTLHGQSLGRLRSTLPRQFGETVWVRSGRVRVRDYYIFGLEDLPSATGRTTRFYGEYLDAEGNRLGMTNGRQAARAGLNQTSDHLLVAIPRNSATARMISALNQQFHQVSQAAVRTQAAEGRLARAEGVLQSAVDDLHARRSGKAFRVLNSTPFSAGVLMLELWNVRSELASWDQTSSEKGTLRRNSGIAGALLDLTIAMEALSVKFASNQSILVSARKALFTITNDSMGKVLGSVLGQRLGAQVTVRLLGQVFAGFIFVGLNLYDTWYAWQWGDDAMWGYLLMAGGGALGLAAGASSAASVFLLSPLGWVALILIVGGAGLAYWLSSAPIEDWMANGPFSDSDTGSTAYLREPQEAFYRLLGLLAGIRISIGKNPDYNPQAKLDASSPIPIGVSSANTRIRIESNLPGLVSQLGSVNIKVECRLRTTQSSYTHGGRSAHSSLSAAQKPVAQRPWSNGLELFFKSPAATSASQMGALLSTTYSWAVKAQFQLAEPGGKKWYFPAPAPKAVVPISEAKKAPNFSSAEQPFWASEQTHSAPDNTK
ncbi:toxin VasX [Pseudomonas sp.]|uniref:toxin VasX n=1 Tax=Pseudomonas sp. TaxID=306 RepID=UPI00299D91EA|nr:toxin VasX [Pseudomonas sp.]MDX1366241.1 toxin VasX [Pseudomonas sp.]